MVSAPTRELQGNGGNFTHLAAQQFRTIYKGCRCVYLMLYQNPVRQASPTPLLRLRVIWISLNQFNISLQTE